MITVLFLLMGLMILAGGLYYLHKSGEDRESRNICMVTVLIGTAVAAGAVIKIILERI